MEKISSSSFKRVVFSFLNGVPDIQKLKIKDVRGYVEHHFSLPDGCLKEPANKSLLEGAVVEYLQSKAAGESTEVPNSPSSSSHTLPIPKSSAGTTEKTSRKRKIDDVESKAPQHDNGTDDSFEKGSRKIGKFSRSESSTIEKAMEVYCKASRMDERQFYFTYFKEDLGEGEVLGQKSRRRNRLREFYDQLQSTLPHRNRLQLRHHIERILLRKYVENTFTPDEDAKLIEMVREQGHKFFEIAKFLGKKPDDCNQRYMRLTRVRHGAFSNEEKLALVRAVYKEMHLKVDVHEPPTEDIPWSKIARDLGSERIPLDYIRNWQHICLDYQTHGHFRSLSSSTPSSSSALQSQSQSQSTAVMSSSSERAQKAMSDVYRQRVRLLEQLAASGAEDETELLWRDYDPIFGHSSGATMCWRIMQRDLPHGDDDDTDDDFQDKVACLLELYRTSLEDAGEEVPPPLSTSSAAAAAGVPVVVSSSQYKDANYKKPKASATAVPQGFTTSYYYQSPMHSQTQSLSQQRSNDDPDSGYVRGNGHAEVDGDVMDDAEYQLPDADQEEKRRKKKDKKNKENKKSKKEKKDKKEKKSKDA